MKTDPAVIKAAQCKTAWVKFGESCRSEPHNGHGSIADTEGTPEYRKWNRANDKVSKEWWAAYSDVVNTKPRTSDGAVALIDAFLEWTGEHFQMDDDEADTVSLLHNLRAFLAA